MTERDRSMIRYFDSFTDISGFRTERICSSIYRRYRKPRRILNCGEVLQISLLFHQRYAGMPCLPDLFSDGIIAVLELVKHKGI